MDLFTLSAILTLSTKEFESGLDSAENKANKVIPGLGTALGGLGDIATSALSTAGNAVLDFAKDVVDTGLKFDKAMSGVYAVTNATEDYRQEALKTAVINEAMSSSFTTAEVAAAAYYEGLAGYNDEEIIAGLHGLVVAAEASGEGIQRTADIITDTVRAFGDTAADQTHYADVLAATATNTNTTINQMGNALKYVAPIAGALDYKIEDVAISLGVMADNGIKGSIAGTSLRSIFQRLATDTGATENSFGALGVLVHELGVQFYDSKGKARPWIDVVKEARTAWKGLTDEQKQTAAEAFGGIASEAETATDSLQDFISELETMRSDFLNGKVSMNDLNTQIESMSTQFNALGINVKDTSGSFVDIRNLYDQVTTKVNGLSDAQQVSYSKQISGQRAMSGWLSLMNATDEKFDATTEAIYNCTDAAENMRDIRLTSNLAGDLEQLNSRFDALKTLIFDEVDGPLRELAQFAISALDSINKAIGTGGLEGGIAELAVQLEKAAEKLEPIFSAIGKAAGPLLESLIDNVLPKLTETATTLGKALVGGLFEGIDDSVKSNSNSSLFMKILNSVTRGWFVGEWDINSEPQQQAFEHQYQVSLKGVVNDVEVPESVTYGGVEIPMDVIAQIDVKQLIRNLEASTKNGTQDLEIWDGYIISNEAAEQLKNDLINGVFKPAGKEGGAELSQSISDAFGTGSTTGMDDMLAIVDASIPTIMNLLDSGISDAGISGAASMGSSIISNVTTGARSVYDYITNAITNAGTSGGSAGATKMESHFTQHVYPIVNLLETKIGQTGENAGNKVASGIQNKLNLWKFGISVIGTITGLFGGSKQYASAMHNGRILHGSTIFGVDSSGDALIGGEAGAEAIIGTDELSRLITTAVSAGSRQSNNTTIQIYQQPGEDPEVLAERVQRVLARQERQRRTIYA